MPNPLRAFRYRNYRLFFGGRIFSMAGLWMQMVAQNWLLHQLTHSSLAVGLLAVAHQGPGLVAGPFGGVLADRHDRRGLLIATQLAAIAPALLLGALTLAGLVRAWHLIAIAAVFGFVRAIEIPVRHAITPGLVGPQDLSNAIALNAATFNSARLIGPALGGSLMVTLGDWDGAGWSFVANGLGFVPFIFALMWMRFPPRAAPASRGSMLSDAVIGLHHVRADRALLLLFAGMFAIGFFAGSWGVLLPAFTDDVLHGGPGAYGYLNSAVAIGAIAGAMTLAARHGGRGLERWTVGGALLLGCSLVALSRARSVWTAAPCLACMGAGFTFTMNTTLTLLQTLSPDAIRGRVMSLQTALFLGTLGVGAPLMGAIADRVGTSLVLTLGGAATALAMLGIARPLLRALASHPEYAAAHSAHAAHLAAERAARR